MAVSQMFLNYSAIKLESPHLRMQRVHEVKSSESLAVPFRVFIDGQAVIYFRNG
jgi:hypothetical protein